MDGSLREELQNIGRQFLSQSPDQAVITSSGWGDAVRHPARDGNRRSESTLCQGIDCPSMRHRGLDEVDKRIISLLQADARMKATDIAEQVPVSANTVRNRIGKLEDAGVIEGYHLDVDFTSTELPLLYQLTCTASISDRETMAQAALEVPGVIEASELMTGQRNLVVRAVGRDQSDVTRIAQELDTLGVEVVDETLIKAHYSRPLEYFQGDSAGTDTVE